MTKKLKTAQAFIELASHYDEIARRAYVWVCDNHSKKDYEEYYLIDQLRELALEMKKVYEIKYQSRRVCEDKQ